jgi:hypothetical protein
MVQPNKVDFDVRKLRKRKRVSRDRMALHEHGECCIRSIPMIVPIIPMIVPIIPMIVPIIPMIVPIIPRDDRQDYSTFVIAIHSSILTPLSWCNEGGEDCRGTGPVLWHDIHPHALG